jgi:UDP-N-acetylmuramyl pentapeptide phosphotransferase/UDP-N-acetylglucosamine-1-phosphate transferase
LAFLIAVVGFGVLGLIDDIAGDRTAGGLRGHFRALIEHRRLTTGAVKFVGGVICALACAELTSGGHSPLLIRAIIIAGAANGLNLVDLRPGRCLTLFTLAYAPLLGFLLWRDLVTPSHLIVTALPVHFAMLTAACLYLSERNAKFMLGDTGSNAFGAVLGLGYAIFAPGIWQWAAAIVIVAFHIWTERHSVSKLIESNRALRAIDRQIGVR